MICRVENTSNPRLKELIDKYGQKEGLRMYAENTPVPEKVRKQVSTGKVSPEYRQAYKEWKSRMHIQNPGYKYSRKQTWNIHKRVSAYNKKYMTDHYVSFEQIGEADQYTAHISFSGQLSMFQMGYTEKAPQPDILKYNDNEVEHNIYTPDAPDVISGVPGDYSDLYDNALPPDQKARYAELSNLRKIERKDLFNSAARLAQTAKKVSAVERSKLLAQRAEKVARIKEIEVELARLVSTHSLTEAKKFFEADKNRLEKLLYGDVNAINDDDLRWAIYTVNLWIRAGEFSGENNHLFWSWSEIQATDPHSENYSPEMASLRDEYVKFGDTMKRLKTVLVDSVLIAKVKAAGKAMLNKDFEWEKDQIYKDMSWIASWTLDIRHADHALTQLMSKLGTDANQGADMEYSDKIREINELVKETGIRDYEWIQQTFGNNDPRITGNMIVRYTQEYYDVTNGWRNHKKNAINSINNTNFRDDIKADSIQRINNDYFRKLKNVSILIDVRKLFPSKESTEKFTEQEIQQHKDLLLKTLGQREYDAVMKGVEEQLLDYERDKVAMYDHYHNTVFSKEQAGEARLAYHVWVRDNSPYNEANIFYGVSAPANRRDYSSPTHYYSTIIAKRFDARGKDLGFYDKKYEAMREDSNKSKMYDYIMDLMGELRNYLPMDKANILQVNSIPNIHKTLVEEFQNSNILGAYAPALDKLKESISGDRSTPEAFTHRDVLDGKLDLRLQTQYIVNSKKEIEDYIERRALVYRADNEVEPTPDIIAEWKKEIQYNIAMRKSYDLPKVMQLFSIMALTYKHRAKVDMTMRAAAMLTFESLEEPDVKSKVQDSKALAKANKLSNMTKTVENYLNHFYGYKERKESKSDILKTEKLSTSEDIAKRAQINEAFEKIEASWKAGKMTAGAYQSAIKKLDEQHEETLGQLSGAKIMDQMLKYYQLVQLGWNPWSATSNLGFGIISNLTQAADGRLFTQQDMQRAYSIVLNNTLFMGKITSVGRKVSSLAMKLSIMKEARYEVMGKNVANTASRKTAKWGTEVIKGFKMQSSTEFMNQTPIMLCLMFNEKITDKDDNEVELWDAFDEEGRLLEKYRTPDNIKDWEDPDNAQKLKNLKAKIDEVIQFTHGNYDHINSPILASSYILGKMAIMFRRWALMGFYERFGGEKFYQATNITRKGRYKSFTPTTLTTALAIAGTFGLPGIGTALGAGIGLLAGYANRFVNGKVGNEMTIGQEAAFTLKYLLMTSPLVTQVRRAVGKEKPSFNEMGYSELDAANLRKNMMEIHILNGLSMFGMLLTYMIKGLGGDDDDHAAKEASLLFLLNQITRMNTDIMFYTNPGEFQRLNKNFIPMLGLATDLARLQDAIAKSMRGDFNYRSGYNKGQNRILVSVARLLPFGKSYMRTKSAIKQKFRPGQFDPDMIIQFFGSNKKKEE